MANKSQKNINESQINTNIYYNGRHIDSFDNYWWYRITIGSRGRGKTYKRQNYILRKFMKQGHQFI